MNTREEVIVNLRRVADLLESNQQVRTPGVDVDFFPSSGEETVAIMTALPLFWQAKEKNDGWIHFNARVGDVTEKFGGTIFAKTPDVGAMTGVREVPAYELRPEITALLQERPKP